MSGKVPRKHLATKATKSSRPVPKHKMNVVNINSAVSATSSISTGVYVCLESESESTYRDNVTVFAVCSSVEAARLACRDKAMQKKDEYFSFDSEYMVS